jgi:hypothetical protein
MNNAFLCCGQGSEQYQGTTGNLSPKTFLPVLRIGPFPAEQRPTVSAAICDGHAPGTHERKSPRVARQTASAACQGGDAALRIRPECTKDISTARAVCAFRGHTRASDCVHVTAAFFLPPLNHRRFRQARRWFDLPARHG